jgi:hypothetical protein
MSKRPVVWRGPGYSFVLAFALFLCRQLPLPEEKLVVKLENSEKLERFMG